MKITRDELFRQLRAQGGELIEDWIDTVSKAPEFPAEIDVGIHIRVMLCLHPRAPADVLVLDGLGRVACEVSGCARSVEIGGSQIPAEVWKTLHARGWRLVDEAGSKVLVCPLHAPAGTTS